MPKPFYHEQSVVVDGETLKLAINFRAIDATEQLTGRDYDGILEEIQRQDAHTGLTGKALWGLLLEHHSDLSMDQILTLLYGRTGETVGLAMRQLFEAAFPAAEEAKAENPPEPHGALSPS